MIVITANFGRGEDDAEFVRNVTDVVEAHDDMAVLCFQEIDEADKPLEHTLTTQTLKPLGRHQFVGWGTFEPIIVPRPRFSVIGEHVEQSSQGVPHLSPARHVVGALIRPTAPANLQPVWVLNNHAPRKEKGTLVEVAANRDTLRREVRHCALTHSVIYLGDENTEALPQLHPDEKTAIHHGMDWIRYVEHPHGATMRLVDTGVIPMTIDNHNALWAQLKIGRWT